MTYTRSKGIDLGTRKVSTMNHSQIVTLPKPFRDNWIDKNSEVQMTMTNDGRLILTPIKTKRRITK